MPALNDTARPLRAGARPGDDLVLDLLRFYQRELRGPENTDAQAALGKLHIHSAEVVEHFALGFASGRAIDAMSEAQYQQLCALGLAKRRRDKLVGCIVLPVYDVEGELVDLCGLRPWDSGLRFVHWQPSHRGLIGVAAVKANEGGALIVTDNPFHALHARQHGYANVIALRSAAEIAQHLPLLEQRGIGRVYLVSRQQRHLIGPPLRQRGIEVVMVKAPHNQVVVPRRSYEAAMATEPAGESSWAGSASPAGGVDRMPPSAGNDEPVQLISRTETRLHFRAGDIHYTLDSAAATGLTMRVQLRAERDGVTFLDRADLGSASARRKVARGCASRLHVAGPQIEDHLARIADAIDAITLEAAREHLHERAPRTLSDDEKAAAMKVLERRDVLAYLAEHVERIGRFIGEEANKRLALLVAASRLLPQPLGTMIRGPAGCGKSALMQAVVQTLPPSEVLYFSRLTPQALYFLPADALRHKLLVCDEYEGLEQSGYALRTVMSSQTLSLAITLREGGKVPVTRTIEMPATLAVMVSTTGSVNIENLSRFIEVGMNASPEQTRRVMQALATPPADDARDVQRVQNVSQLLRPCSVVIPFADQLTYAAHSVLARRKFAQVVGLISAHAALHQHQRAPVDEHQVQANEPLVIEATTADYEAVHPLLAHIVEHFEESVSPAAMRLLEHVQEHDIARLTRRQVMEAMGWSYSQAYRVLQELVHLDLLVPDNTTNGVLRTYDIAPFHKSEHGVSRITPPQAIR